MGDFGQGGTTAGPGQGETPTPLDGELPQLPEMPSQWIESQWDGSPEGVVQMIESASHGERSQATFQQLLLSYADVAETANQQEDIPLTRRAYIQHYFETIRH